MKVGLGSKTEMATTIFLAVLAGMIGALPALAGISF